MHKLNIGRDKSPAYGGHPVGLDARHRCLKPGIPIILYFEARLRASGPTYSLRSTEEPKSGKMKRSDGQSVGQCFQPVHQRFGLEKGQDTPANAISPAARKRAKRIGGQAEALAYSGDFSVEPRSGGGIHSGGGEWVISSQQSGKGLNLIAPVLFK